LRPRGQQYDSSSALGQSETAGIDDAVCPLETALLELRDQPLHRTTAVELKHERNVLEDQPSRPAAFRQKPEHMLHQSRVAATDTCRKSGLAEIFARETRRPHVSRWKPPYLADVITEPHVGKSRAEHGLSVGIDFTQEDALVTGPLHSQLDSADARE
jgi:hypothetical protein